MDVVPNAVGQHQGVRVTGGTQGTHLDEATPAIDRKPTSMSNEASVPETRNAFGGGNPLNGSRPMVIWRMPGSSSMWFNFQNKGWSPRYVERMQSMLYRTRVAGRAAGLAR